MEFFGHKLLSDGQKDIGQVFFGQMVTCFVYFCGTCQRWERPFTPLSANVAKASICYVTGVASVSMTWMTCKYVMQRPFLEYLRDILYAPVKATSFLINSLVVLGGQDLILNHLQKCDFIGTGCVCLTGQSGPQICVQFFTLSLFLCSFKLQDQFKQHAVCYVEGRKAAIRTLSEEDVF